MAKRERKPNVARACHAALTALLTIAAAKAVRAEEIGGAPTPSSRAGVHAGAGLTVGWASLVDPHRGGPWLEGSVPIAVGLSSTAYVQIEPGLAWYSFERKGQVIMTNSPSFTAPPAGRSTESNWQLLLLVRGMLGIDLGPSFTVRAGPVLGWTTAHVHSELCTGSTQALVTGVTAIPEWRVGAEHRFAFGPQIDFLWPRSPYCIYPGIDFSQPAILHPDRKPIISVLLHASVSF